MVCAPHSSSSRQLADIFLDPAQTRMGDVPGAFVISTSLLRCGGAISCAIMPTGKIAQIPSKHPVNLGSKSTGCFI